MLQANDVANDPKRQELWNTCRLSLLLQVIVEMPGTFIDRKRFNLRLNQ